MKNSHKQIKSFLYIGSGIIFVAIGSFVGFQQLKPYLQVKQCTSWQPVQATLLNVKVFDDWSEPGRTKRGGIKYFIDIRYQYSFKNQNYTGTRYSFYNFYNSAADGRKLHSFVKNNPPGTKISCFVNTENPAEAVVNREKHNQFIILILAIPFFLIGFYFIIVKSEIFRSSKKKEISDEK